MGNEVLDFANQIDAIDLKSALKSTVLSHVHHNYFLLIEGAKKNFLIIKISREGTQFWGVNRKVIDYFNEITETNGSYFVVLLESNQSGWFLPKKEILSQIRNNDLSYSEKGDQYQYKINYYNLIDRYYFTSTEDFLEKIRVFK